jgi:hypothetical protein
MLTRTRVQPHDGHQFLLSLCHQPSQLSSQFRHSLLLRTHSSHFDFLCVHETRIRLDDLSRELLARVVAPLLPVDLINRMWDIHDRLQFLDLVALHVHDKLGQRTRRLSLPSPIRPRSDSSISN